MKFSNKDQRWKDFNKSLIEEAQKMNWARYTLIRLEMAKFLEKEKRLENALETYLEILYFDQNGPNDREGCCSDVLKEFPTFDPKLAFIAPGIINRIRILNKKLKATLGKIKEIFIYHNQRIYENFKMPINPKEAWENLEKEIKNNLD